MQLFSQPRTGRKSSNRRFIEALGAQNTVNTDVCCTLEAQKHGIYEVFASGNKNRGNYSVFWPVPSKNTGIYAVFSMLQEDARSIFSMPKAQKHCKLECFGSALRVRGGGVRGGPEMNSSRLNKSGTWAGQPPLYFVKLNSR